MDIEDRERRMPTHFEPVEYHEYLCLETEPLPPVDRQSVPVKAWILRAQGWRLQPSGRRRLCGRCEHVFCQDPRPVFGETWAGWKVWQRWRQQDLAPRAPTAGELEQGRAQIRWCVLDALYEEEGADA